LRGRRVDHVLRFLALGAAFAVTSPATAQTINQYVGFGDSTIDSGWYRNNLDKDGDPFAGGGANFNALFPDAVRESAVALYMISSGGNNIDFAINHKDPADRAPYVIRAAKNEIAAVVQLKAAGGRYIIIPNLSDNPVAFGLTLETVSTDNPACKAVLPNVDAAALLCNSSKAPLVAPNADQTHLFADEAGHFATKGQKIYADYLYSLVIAPSEISLLAENPVKSRTATIDLIMNQIPISQRTRGPLGFNVWASGDVSRLKIDRPVGFVGESATPTQVTAGIDTMTSGGILLGMAVSAGTKKASFSQGGSFTQDEFAVSGYSAATLGPLWLNMIGTFGALHYDVNRVVPLGPVLEQNNTTTNGTNMSFSVRSGYNAVVGPLTHGPVIGLTLQSVHIDGFTESGNVTSLDFGEQYRHSSVGVLGYQASFDFGMFQPFAKALWNHEFVSNDRLVTVSPTSTVAPSYSLPAVNLGKDWASATAGVSVGLGKGVTGLVSFTGQLGQDKVTTYGGQVGVNVAF
jgi:outer membrane lipase/esterase